MDSMKFDNIKMEKSNAISRYRRVERIKTLFRVLELLVVAIVVSRLSTQFPLQLKMSGEYIRGISVALSSPRFVFLVGNAIVLVLFFKSGGFSAKDREGIADFYDEYVEKCRSNEGKKEVEDYRVYGVGRDESRRKMGRSSSAMLERSVVVHGNNERCRELTRSMTEDCRRRRKQAAEEMSSEEFRRTVEAFIARQQRFLREED